MEFLSEGGHGHGEHGQGAGSNSATGSHGAGGHAAHGETICSSSQSSCLLQTAPDCDKEPCMSKFTIMIFPFFALFIGIVATPLSRVVRISYTLVLLIIGILLGALGCGVNLGLLSTSLGQWVHLNPPTAFFYVFLSPLIFEAAFNTRWHVFKRLLIPILTAAFIIVTLQVGLIAAFQKLVIRTAKWSWWAALMFGSMLSATDPISVTATLKSLGASEMLNTLIEGESLLNDGSAFVLWEAFFENTKDSEALTVGEIVTSIFRLSLGGAAMGIAFGTAALVILGLVYDEFEVETSLTVIVAFLGFWTAQAPSKLSGVICNVASGLVISAFGRHLITPAVREPLAEFWELLGWVANTVVFVHAGVLLTAFIWSCTGEPNAWYDYVYIIVYYLYLQVIRIGLILIFKPIMRLRNQWFNLAEAFVVGFSGLRGAVSLVLALEVGGNPDIPDEVKSRVVLWTTGIVALSLLLNGFLVKPLIHILKLDRAKKSREDFLKRARALMVQKTLTILDSLCIESNFKSSRWSYVRTMVLPEEWLEESAHAEGYKDFIEQILDNKNVTSRKSLETVRTDAQEKIVHSHVNRRMSLEFGTRSIASATPHMSPRNRRYDYAADIARYSRSPVVAAAQGPEVLSPGADAAANPHYIDRRASPLALPLPRPAANVRVPSRFQEIPSLGEHGLGAAAVGTETGNAGTDRVTNDAARPNAAARDGGQTPALPSTPASAYAQPFSMRSLSSARTHTDFGLNRSIDVDMERYGTGYRYFQVLPTQDGIQRDLEALHRRATTAGEPVVFSENDQEVRRRLLTAILSHVRAISNTSLVEFSALHSLEEDVQKALDANEEDREYDLFSFLYDRARPSRGPLYHMFIRAIEGHSLRGEMAITTAFIVHGILSEILKEDLLLESSAVQHEAESLYQTASAMLKRLEALNPDAFEWVESQFAIYVCSNKQDVVLEDLLESGIVDDSEYHTLHEELVEVRRKYVHHRHSIFHRNTKLPPRATPRQLIKTHPLFSGLPSDLMQIVNRYHELVHLNAGQELKAERGSLVLVLEGSIRPQNQTVLPESVASQLRKSNTQVTIVDKDTGAKVGKVYPTTPEPVNAWTDAYMAENNNGDDDDDDDEGGEDNDVIDPSARRHDEDEDEVEVEVKPRHRHRHNRKEANIRALSGVTLSEQFFHHNDREAGFTPLGSGGAVMHWCFPAHNAFCGPVVTLLSHAGDDCSIAKERVTDTRFKCCEMAHRATVFTLPVRQVKELARKSESFRTEITLSLARQIALESVADQHPYRLSQFMSSAFDALDVHTVVGRAIRVLERLPYMKVIPLHSGESSSVHLQGPGVLLNGTVRVSIVDTSGLVGAINLLHEELTGPALLPAGGLFLEEVHSPDDPSLLKRGFTGRGGETGEIDNIHSEAAEEASLAIKNLYGGAEEMGGKGSRILAHVLIEEVVTTISGMDRTALERFHRWTESDEKVDMNGRFGMNRHVDYKQHKQQVNLTSVHVHKG